MKVETNIIFVYAQIMAGKTLKIDERIINLKITAYFTFISVHESVIWDGSDGSPCIQAMARISVT